LKMGWARAIDLSFHLLAFLGKGMRVLENAKRGDDMLDTRTRLRMV
jgi:hypothetical protein